MARTNTTPKPAPIFTHEGAKATRTTATEQLRRSVMACLLFEKEFYEDGQSIADRITTAAHAVPLQAVTDLAIEARHEGHLRHAPLWLTVAALNHPEARTPKKGANPSQLLAACVDEVCQRADDMGELLSLYWKGGKRPLAASLKDGLRRAFEKFDQYRLAKYASRGAIRLRDVMFLVHPKPRDDEQAALWALLADDKLPPADTWEVALSSGADKRETFDRLLSENKLGGLATLRNLRNMRDAGVEKVTVAAALLQQAGKSGILPFQYVAAARAVPAWEDAIEPAMLAALAETKKLAGKTVLLVDVSGSMEDKLSAKSELRRIDAASALAMLLREVCEEVEIVAFHSQTELIAPRRGFALRDLIGRPRGGTDTGRAVMHANLRKPDRIIIITDEQSHTQIAKPHSRGYIMNVASYQNGIGYGAWTHVSGFSENLVRYIVEAENNSQK